MVGGIEEFTGQKEGRGESECGAGGKEGSRSMMIGVRIVKVVGLTPWAEVWEGDAGGLKVYLFV